MKRLFVLLLAAVGSLHAAPTPSMNYNSNVFIDEGENIKMYWNHDADYITMELHANTAGYVAVGFSPGGKMEGSDIIIGWVKDGKAFLQDRYAIGNSKPSLDQKQDVELLMGKEEDGYTILKFRRKIDTCDTDHDQVVRSGTVKMIWALGTTDPHDEDGIYYHSSRGQRNIQLLGVIKKAIPLPANAVSHDLLNNDYKVPAEATTYACQVLRMPKVDKKQHIVMYEPIITKGHEAMVHHILVYGCTTSVPINDTHEGQQFFCHKNHGEMPWFRWNCNAAILAWAVGGEPMYLPEHAGFSIGTSDDPDFMIMETHYDNPMLISDRVDNSGLRFHYTPTIRTFDAGVIDQGKSVDLNHIIPPKADAFKSFSICHQDCMNDALADTPDNEIRIFSVGLHSHLLGVGIKTWLIRDGVEQPPIAEDKYYDFNYQTSYDLPKEVVIKPNDVIATECTYRSTMRENVTYGGLSTKEEMCISFIHYYPRMKLLHCGDRTSELSIFPFAGIESVNDDNTIKTPEKFANMTWKEVYDHKIDWTNGDTRAKFQEVDKYGLRTPYCLFGTPTGSAFKHQDLLFNFTVPRKYYQEPKSVCPINGGARIETRMFRSVLIGILCLLLLAKM